MSFLCRITFILSAFFAFSIHASEPLPPVLDQNTLDKLIAEKWGVIYSVSPAMPLSLDGYKELRKAMEPLKGELIVLWDPDVEKKYFAKAVKKMKLKSPSYLQGRNVLLKQGADLHYPTLWLFKNGKIGPHSFVGYKSAESFSSWIREEKDKL